MLKTNKQLQSVNNFCQYYAADTKGKMKVRFVRKSLDSIRIAIIVPITIAIVNITMALLDPSLAVNIHDLWRETLKTFANNEDDNLHQSIDIISIGTILKPDLQLAQYETFGSHPTIRNHYSITELNDTDLSCSNNLTESHFYKVRNFCTAKDSNKKYTGKILKLLHQESGKSSFRPRSIGWLCAQKRPIDGLYNVLHPYQTAAAAKFQNIDSIDVDIVLAGTNLRIASSKQPLPKYLIIMDDDTYMNMTFIVETLMRRYPNYDEPHILAGCLLRFNQKVIYRFPFGGYGTIITRKVMEKLIRPIDCSWTREKQSTVQIKTNIRSIWNDMINYGFSRCVCRQLQQNLIGELTYFRDGMSLLDLMHTFSSKLLFGEVDDWANGTGYCFHSDHALAYFFGYYYIGVTDSIFTYYNPIPFQTARYRRRRGYGYNLFVEDEVSSTCDHANAECGNSTTICHYVNADRMHELYQKEK